MSGILDPNKLKAEKEVREKEYKKVISKELEEIEKNIKHLEEHLEKAKSDKMLLMRNYYQIASQGFLKEMSEKLLKK